MAGGTKRARCANRSGMPKPETTALATEGTGTELAALGTERPLRPGQCRAHMRNTLAKEFRAIVDGFVKEAKSGSCQHVKLATELLQPPARKTKSGGRKSTGTLNRWLEEIERAD